MLLTIITTLETPETPTDSDGSDESAELLPEDQLTELVYTLAAVFPADRFVAAAGVSS
jgi:hypothetical protein